MKFIAKTAPIEKETADCVIVGMFESGEFSPAGKKLDTLYQDLLSDSFGRGALRTTPGQVTTLQDSSRTRHACIIVAGCGKQDRFTIHTLQRALSAAVSEAKARGASSVINGLVEMPVPNADTKSRVQASIVATQDTLYTYTRTKSGASSGKASPKTMKFLASRATETRRIRQGIASGEAIAGGMKLTKDLGNLPGNICTPSYLARQARSLKRDYPNLRVTVLGEVQMKKLGMGAFLSVTHGSAQPAKLVCMEYRGAKHGQRPVVLIGKGITFDTGGISLKPGSAMDEMKFDMCGAGSVLGTIKACCMLDMPMNVVGILACAENMPGGKASRPGDVVNTMSGQTVEILNTDAEGRLVLCDALTYAKRFKPELVIDIATLTGACVVALGHVPAGLMSNDEPLVSSLLEAGEHSGDRAWRLPLWDDYQSQLDSNFADMANIGGRWAGTITAACFLSRFTEAFRWAHLDIAGVAWHSQGKRKGATGRPVPLLTQFLLQQATRRRH